MSLSCYRKGTLRNAAKQLGVSATCLHDIEHGKRCPSYELFEKMKSSGLYEEDFFRFFEVVTVKKVIPHWF